MRVLRPLRKKENRISKVDKWILSLFEKLNFFSDLNYRRVFYESGPINRIRRA